MMSPLVIAINLVLFGLAVVSPVVLVVALVQLGRTRRLLAEVSAKVDRMTGR